MFEDNEIAVFGQAEKKKRPSVPKKIKKQVSRKEASSFLQKAHLCVTVSLLATVLYLIQVNTNLSLAIFQANSDRDAMKLSYEKKLQALEGKLSKANAKLLDSASHSRIDSMLSADLAQENKNLLMQLNDMQRMLDSANSKISDLAKPTSYVKSSSSSSSSGSRQEIKTKRSDYSSSNPFEKIFSSVRKPAAAGSTLILESSPKPKKKAGESSWEDADAVY
ncbi:hypothetical protein [Bacteriovorax sp. Seq25_V]|uniref:hypothetical protein n=1 Tax=Bacteriovorax sp. Seq25_V TaxID=1201288 RepID=UPI000429A593|nr:hypothetical protein [Bacteriovorax sp. Seq25_V]